MKHSELANTDDDYINDDVEQLQAAMLDFEDEIGRDAKLERGKSLESLTQGVLNKRRLLAAVRGGVETVGKPSEWAEGGTRGAAPQAQGILDKAKYMREGASQCQSRILTNQRFNAVNC